MQPPFNIPIWKTAPFIRILPPLIAGILLQWYLQVSLLFILIAFISFSIGLLLYELLPTSTKFAFPALRGVCILLLWMAGGALLSWKQNVNNNSNWYGNFYTDSSYIIATINEPVVEKTKSYKADALVEVIITDGKATTCEGKILLYFAKDSSLMKLHYGDQILVHKKLQPIKNSGNPGAFNYQRYALFQQIVHNAFLKDKDWIKLNTTSINHFKQFLFSTREKILTTLQSAIGNNKDELGIAEALLIGYTNDLDKDLVQAYSNTGVVHIIAISGMHLGLIYVMLVWIFARAPYIKNQKWLQVVLILASLWIFSLLTGGSASVLRSAVMFTIITIGKNYFKQHSIFNSLASSAFLMLVYNPFYLWDVGFQLSYLAVIGIIVFQKPIYNLLYVKNKKADYVWNMISVTLAAQVLTFPVCIYYFHQFPLLFLITNVIAVPLSTIILFAEIFLVAFSWIPFVMEYAGKATAWLVWLMNKIILYINELPFAVWDRIPSTVFTTWLLYAFVIGTGAWLLNKNRKFLNFSLTALIGFLIMHSFIGWKIASQQKLIVYNVPQHQAIDFVNGNNYRFVGDSILLEDALLQNFHLKPGRIALQLTKRVDSLSILYQQAPFFQLGNSKILVVNAPLETAAGDKKIPIDIAIISKNPKLRIASLAKVFDIQKVVFDASNSLWKIAKWKQECEALHLRHHSIPEQGAFVMDIE